MSTDNVHELRLSGHLTESDVIKLKSSMAAHIKEHAGKIIRVDLSDLENVSGTILSLLLCSMREADRYGCELIMTGFSQRLYDMARVGGLETVLPVSNG